MKQLRLVNGENRLNCLDFDDDTVIDQKSDPISEIDRDAVVLDWKELFGLDTERSFRQLDFESLAVGPFAHSRAQPSLDAECCTENRVRRFSVQQMFVTSLSHRGLRGEAFAKQASGR
jgi:hypothetical protein